MITSPLIYLFSIHNHKMPYSPPSVFGSGVATPLATPISAAPSLVPSEAPASLPAEALAQPTPVPSTASWGTHSRPPCTESAFASETLLAGALGPTMACYCLNHRSQHLQPYHLQGAATAQPASSGTPSHHPYAESLLKALSAAVQSTPPLPPSSGLPQFPTKLGKIWSKHTSYWDDSCSCLYSSE